MSWNEVAVFAEAAASFAVVVSLVYLAIQVRLQSKQNQMSVINSLTQQWVETTRVFAIDQDLYSIWKTGLTDFEGLSPDERGRFSSMMVGLTQIFEGLHLHHRMGRVDPELWQGFDCRLRDVFATPGAQTWWKLRRHWHTQRFQDYVDRAIASSGHVAGRYVAIYGANADQ